MIKRKTRSYLCLCLTLVVICIGILGVITVRATTIEKYENQISENNIKVEQIKSIKNQLHITATMLREENTLDNGFSDTLSLKWHEYHNRQTELETQNVELTNKIEDIKSRTKLMGYFKITHYCNCSKCCGKYAGGKTASGTYPTEGRTIAVDPKVIPLGSKVMINNHVYIAEDTGGAIKGNKIDMYVSSHSGAYARGVLKNVPVYIIKE